MPSAREYKERKFKYAIEIRNENFNRDEGMEYPPPFILALSRKLVYYHIKLYTALYYGICSFDEGKRSVTISRMKA